MVIPVRDDVTALVLMLLEADLKGGGQNPHIGNNPHN
jgi:hypothetical protein